MNLTKAHSPILVLAPHTDDGEIGCGGVISACIEKGLEVYYVAFSSAQISLPEGVPKDTLVKEVTAATKTLGIPRENLIILDFPTRTFPKHRQEILEKLIELRRKIAPKLIFTPSLNDVHQDHATIAIESVRAFKKNSILSYEEPWNNISFTTNFFFKLEERHIAKKVEACLCYKSQYHRPYLSEESVRALARVRGTQLDGGYAEAFEVIRWMA